MKYRLYFTKGTASWVTKELKEKHLKANIIETQDDVLFFSSPEEIVGFKDLLSALSIYNIDSDREIKLSKRLWHKMFVDAGINAALAYILCKIAEIKPKDIVYDPFCGSGTIAISGALYFKPEKVLASDVSGRAISALLENVKSAGVQKKIVAFRSNISMIKLAEESVDIIITNLPFGIREKSHDENVRIYESFARILKRILKKDGRAVILTQEIKLIKAAMGKYELTPIKEYKIEQGGLAPRIFIITKNPNDEK